MSRDAVYENERVPELRQRAHDMWAEVDKMDQENLSLKQQQVELVARRRELMRRRNAMALEADVTMKEWEKHNSHGNVSVSLSGPGGN